MGVFLLKRRNLPNSESGRLPKAESRSSKEREFLKSEILELGGGGGGGVGGGGGGRFSFILRKFLAMFPLIFEFELQNSPTKTATSLFTNLNSFLSLGNLLDL